MCRAPKGAASGNQRVAINIARLQRAKLLPFQHLRGKRSLQVHFSAG
jgi:hypothetical protein